MNILETAIFTLKSIERMGTTFYRLECPDWINIIPLTSQGEVVMVRQSRFGTDQETIEIPGGQMDPEDSSPLVAAIRELEEETGYGKGEWEGVGWVHPNPAILNNRCHFFLARNVEKVGPIRNDPHEHTEVEIMKLSDIPTLIANQTINHGLVINAFSQLALFKPDLFPWKV